MLRLQITAEDETNMRALPLRAPLLTQGNRCAAFRRQHCPQPSSFPRQNLTQEALSHSQGTAAVFHQLTPKYHHLAHKLYFLGTDTGTTPGRARHSHATSSAPRFSGRLTAHFYANGPIKPLLARLQIMLKSFSSGLAHLKAKCISKRGNKH